MDIETGVSTVFLLFNSLCMSLTKCFKYKNKQTLLLSEGCVASECQFMKPHE